MRSKFRLAPSTVLAALALFVALGGTSYAVSSQINGEHLKNRSVAGTKLKKHTVTGADVNVSRFPKVPAAHQADDATNATTAVHATTAAEAGTLTGTINGGQVTGAVASAITATTATNATDATSASSAANATNATNATNLVGHSFAQIDASAGSGAPATLLSDFGVTVECIGLSGSSGTVTLAVVDSSAQAGSFGAGSIDGAGSAHFDSGPVIGATGGVPATTSFTFPINGGGAQMSFSYRSAAGNTTEVVSGTFTMVIDNGCSAVGNADASSVAN